MTEKENRADYALTMLSIFLAKGPKPFNDVRKFCVDRGITKTELRQARRAAQVKTVHENGTWYWSETEDDADA